jgi:KRAB domain-containing zinc finger protein
MERVIEKHFKEHTAGKFYSCKLCFELFQTQTQLEFHLDMRHKKNSKSSFKCRRCSSAFNTRVELSIHVASTDCKENNDKTFQCYICNKIFSMGIAKKQHIMQEHQDKAGTDCPLCLRCKIPSAIAFENHYRTHFVAARFCCSYCGRSFHESDRLQTHIRRSHENTKLICFWCNKTFRDKSGIARHILGVHFNERKFKCNVCWKAFSASYNLKEHMFAVHKTASKYYTCEGCNTDFLYRKQFERHKIICAGQSEKPKKR